MLLSRGLIYKFQDNKKGLTHKTLHRKGFSQFVILDCYNGAHVGNGVFKWVPKGFKYKTSIKI